jgi:Uma2 family endonuclease
MGMAAAATKEWTYEMLESLPDDGNRYEIIDGELFVTPPPAFGHQRAQWELGRLIANYLALYRVGQGFFAPGDVIIDRRNVVEPDIFVVPRDIGEKPASWKDIKSLLLAVEILSPSTARADRHRKRLLYQRFKVGEYWIVDSDARVIDRWRPADARAETLSEHIEWQPVSEYPSLRIDLAEFFALIHGELA